MVQHGVSYGQPVTFSNHISDTPWLFFFPASDLSREHHTPQSQPQKAGRSRRQVQPAGPEAVFAIEECTFSLLFFCNERLNSLNRSRGSSAVVLDQRGRLSAISAVIILSKPLF